MREQREGGRWGCGLDLVGVVLALLPLAVGRERLPLVLVVLAPVEGARVI